MHEAARAFARRQIAELGPFADVVEFGSLNINGSARTLFPKGTPYLGVDVQEGPGVDVVADVVTVIVPAADVVVCMEVLEHAPDKAGVIDAAHRALRPGGVLILTAATDPRAPHSAVDEMPIRDWEFYENVDPDHLRALLAGWSSATVEEPGHGDVYAVAVK